MVMYDHVDQLGAVVQPSPRGICIVIELTVIVQVI